MNTIDHPRNVPNFSYTMQQPVVAIRHLSDTCQIGNHGNRFKPCPSFHPKEQKKKLFLNSAFPLQGEKRPTIPSSWLLKPFNAVESLCSSIKLCVGCV